MINKTKNKVFKIINKMDKLGQISPIEIQIKKSRDVKINSILNIIYIKN